MSSSINLLLEAARVNYRLRSTFFLRKLNEYNTFAFVHQIAALIPFATDYDWTQRATWGIGEDAFALLQAPN